MKTETTAMKVAGLLGSIAGIALTVIAVVLIVSVFPAIIGWALATVVGLFTVVDLSYWQYVGLGLGFAIITSVAVSIAKG